MKLIERETDSDGLNKIYPIGHNKMNPAMWTGISLGLLSDEILE